MAFDGAEMRATSRSSFSECRQRDVDKGTPGCGRHDELDRGGLAGRVNDRQTDLHYLPLRHIRRKL